MCIREFTTAACVYVQQTAMDPQSPATAWQLFLNLASLLEGMFEETTPTFLNRGDYSSILVSGLVTARSELRKVLFLALTVTF